MASIAGLEKIVLPTFTQDMPAEDARVLRSYMYQLQEQLQYVLTNIDTENLSQELRTKLQNL